MGDMTRRNFLRTAGAGAAVVGAGAVGAARAWAADKIKITDSDALLVIDVQNCFVPGGSLAVKEGDEIVPLINHLAKSFQNVVLTQDWHTADHVSFASQHDGKKPFETIGLAYGTQVLWPDHCVQGTEGAAIVSGINIPQAELIIRKGFHKDVDSYSAFLEADRKTETGLAGYLKGRKHQPRVRVRSGDRLLRRMVGAGRAQVRLPGRRDRGCMPRHRPQRFVGQGLGRTWRRSVSSASSRRRSPDQRQKQSPTQKGRAAWLALFYGACLALAL